MIGNKLRTGLKPVNPFERGQTPWNLGLSVHLSPESEFKKGRIAPERLPVGTERIRLRRAHRRVFIKVSDPNKWKLRSVKRWEDANGPVPTGRIIHHEDRDTLNDELTNLACLTRAEHLAEHRHELQAARW
jgi:hypothetical protein